MKIGDQQIRALSMTYYTVWNFSSFHWTLTEITAREQEYAISETVMY